MPIIMCLCYRIVYRIKKQDKFNEAEKSRMLYNHNKSLIIIMASQVPHIYTTFIIHYVIISTTIKNM